MAVTSEELKIILDAKLNPLYSEIANLKEQLRETNSFLEFANVKYEEVLARFEKFEKDKNHLMAENSTLKKTIQVMDEQIKQLQKESNDMKQYSRRDCLEIQGIPYNREESSDDIIKKVGDLMDVYLGDNDISISHRLPLPKSYKGKRSTPPLIVKFTRRTVKEKFYKARTKLKGCNTMEDLGYTENNRIFINECLTEQNQQLFNECLKFKKQKKLLSIWTSNGKVYLRKDINTRAILIGCKDDLRKVQASIP